MSLLKPQAHSSAWENLAQFRSSLGSWFLKEGKDFPWRRTEDPYEILISEVMLQQTRLATVLDKGYYTNFLKKFPEARSLAIASDDELLKAWEGLGYYRRARMLRSTAQAIVAKHAGIFPHTEPELLALPGIGPYTSAALLSFAFHTPAGLVDGNVSRVLSRLLDDSSEIDSPATMKRHRQLALSLCDPDHPRRHNQAMMELGQIICKKGTPECERCPVSQFCQTRSPELLPVKKPRAKTTHLEEHVIWIRDEQSRLLLHKETGSRRTGLWKLPVREAVDCENLSLITTEKYAITRYIVNVRIYSGELDRLSIADGDAWISLDQIDSLAMAAPYRKITERILGDF